MKQRSFFDPAPTTAQNPPHVRDSDTSREAAEQIKPAVGGLRRKVYEFIRERGDRGATDEEVCEGLNLRSDTARARRCELRDAGMIRDSGRQRATRSGRNAVVWVAVPDTEFD